jgi:hypothetical protein
MNAREQARVLRMVDQWECQKLHEQYWYAEAKRDVDAVCAVFCEGARYGTATGRDQIRAKVQGYMNIMGNVLENFHIAPIIANIAVEGDRASGEIRGVGFIKMLADGAEKIVTVGIGYFDEFVRTPEGWRIASMQAIDPVTDAPHDTTWQFETPVTAVGIASLQKHGRDAQIDG